MKKYILSVVLVLSVTTLEAQTFAEFFKQKKTQKKYLLQQIAALKVYSGYIEKGYAIVSDGLHIIGTLKNGELNLHSAFFHSLENINPKIANYSRVADIVLLQKAIVRNCKNVLGKETSDNHFNAQEQAYIRRVFQRLLEDGATTVKELTAVVTSGELEMNDRERLERINRLYNEMQDQYLFSKRFIQGIQWMAAYREKGKRAVKTGRALYGLQTPMP